MGVEKKEGGADQSRLKKNERKKKRIVLMRGGTPLSPRARRRHTKKKNPVPAAVVRENAAKTVSGSCDPPKDNANDPTLPPTVSWMMPPPSESRLVDTPHTRDAATCRSNVTRTPSPRGCIEAWSGSFPSRERLKKRMFLFLWIFSPVDPGKPSPSSSSRVPAMWGTYTEP